MAQTNQFSDATVAGTLKRVTFHSPDTGFFIAVIDSDETKGGPDEIVVKGVSTTLHEGASMKATGRWETSKWGRQFKARSVQMAPPQGNKRALQKYLASILEGVGETWAKKLVDLFGLEVLEKLRKEPHLLKDIKGLGKKKIQAITKSLALEQADEGLRILLMKAGIGTGRHPAVLKILGESAERKIRKDPYVLCKVPGIGFLTADRLAIQEKYSRTAPERIREGILYLLELGQSAGSCGAQLLNGKNEEGEDILKRDGTPAQKGLIAQACSLLEVSEDLVHKSIEAESKLEAGSDPRGYILAPDSRGQLCAFLRPTYFVEEGIAKRLARMVQGGVARSIENADALLQEVQARSDIELAPEQRSALELALKNQVCVITGGPGCGKTTITRLLLNAFSRAGFEPTLVAPTGKAAKRAEEATGYPAATIHRTFGYSAGGAFDVNENSPLKSDVLVVDEASMVDVFLMLVVLRGLSPRTRLVFVGDVDQLASVGPGKVLGDMIESEVIPTMRLRAVYRQAAGSAIVRNAHKINQGKMIDLKNQEGSDFEFYPYEPLDREDVREKERVREELALSLISRTLAMREKGFDPLRDVQVYSPMRRGPLGVQVLNARMQAALNPDPMVKFQWGASQFGVGDKVMQIKNNRYKMVFNGTVGIVTKADAGAKRLTVQFDDGVVEYVADEINELTLAYVITVHKSQGSESPVVLLALDYGHYMMLKRNLLYTGVTRAKKLCVVLGDREAIRKAISDNQSEDRHTRLSSLLVKHAIQGGHENA